MSRKNDTAITEEDFTLEPNALSDKVGTESDGLLLLYFDLEELAELTDGERRLLRAVAREVSDTEDCNTTNDADCSERITQLIRHLLCGKAEQVHEEDLPQIMASEEQLAERSVGAC